MKAPIEIAAEERDARIKAAQDKAWAKREAIMRECQREIDAAWADYQAAAWRGLHRVMAKEAA